MKTCPQCKLTYPDERTFCFVDGADLHAVKDPRLGAVLAGRYLLEDVLGQGGMATVYAGRHTLVDRRCAIKIMHPMLARDSVVRERFRREAQSARKLAHPNVIEIFDQGETGDGTSYIVMERLDGGSLFELIRRGPVDIHRALNLMIQMSRGIARAHDLDVIHRDLKPENIFICKREDGSDLVKLLDFGIARSLHDTRLTGQGEIFGTPQYMAPERISTTESGPPADLYALGIIFFELVTGALPFHSEDVAGFFVKHLKEAPASPRAMNEDVPPDLEALILRLLAKDPKARPVDAHRVHQDLIAIAEQVGAALPQDVVDDTIASTSSRGTSELTPPKEPAMWRRRTDLFQEMLVRAFGTDPPAEQRRMLEELRAKTARIAELRDIYMEAQRKLEEIVQRGREGRQRFGFAVDALGVDASKAKDDERSSREAFESAEIARCALLERYTDAHREVLKWEGRSGFSEPYLDLAIAYRAAAAQVEAWGEARAVEREARERLDAAVQAVSDIEFQIRALRAALASHEQEIEAGEAALEIRITRSTKEAEYLDEDLERIAARFCEPLQRRPELRPLFVQLEADVA